MQSANSLPFERVCAAIVLKLLACLTLLLPCCEVRGQGILVMTLPANSISLDSATLNGLVDPNGFPASVYFRYGLTTNYGSFSTTNTVTASNTVSSSVSGLLLECAYHFQVVAANANGTSFGDDMTFTTLPSSARSGLANDGFDPNVNGQVRTVAIQADGRIILGGAFTTVGGITRSNLARINVDGSVGSTFHPDANSSVDCLAEQPDGKILIGGGFTVLGGVARSRIGRLNPDGSVDEGFNPGADSFVQYLALQPDGRILVGGQFTMLGGQPRPALGRLNADGSLDTSFNPLLNQGNVYRIIVQPNGKILVGGSFTQINGQARNYLARLNGDGTVESGFNPGADFPVRGMALQLDGKILVGGYFTTLGGQPRGSLGRLNRDGSLDADFNPGANNTVQSFAVQSDGKILVGGSLTSLGGQTHNRLGRLNADGSLDTSFAAEAGGTTSPFVYALAQQADGKIVVGGIFTNLNGLPRNYVGRLYPDGTADATFNPAADNYALSLAVQPDGRILTGGMFTNLAGQARNRLGRLKPDGSLDATFDPGAGADNVVRTVVVQTDGKIVAGGFFTSLAGQPRIHIGRLNADGTLDAAFNPGTDAGIHPVYGMALQPDGKIVVGGQFTMLGGQPRNSLGRLNPDGIVDAAFNPGANGYVLSLALQGDGKILAGGVFTTLAGQTRNRIGRLNADGTIDGTFSPSADNTVEALAVQADGKVLVAGYFSTLAGQPRSHIGRLNADGSLDAAFNPGADGVVFCVASQPDGKILVGGYFTVLGGANRNNIGRLNADGTVDASFNPGASSTVMSLAAQVDGSVIASGSFSTLGRQPRSFFGRLTSGNPALQEFGIDMGGTTATWSRSGAGPELQEVAFEQSLNGTNYIGLGSATRIAGGWQMTGLAVPVGQNCYLRARGIAPTSYNSSSGLIESVRQFYLPARLTGIASLTGGSLALGGKGAVGHAYVLLATSNFVPPVVWTPIATNTADGNGVLSFSDLMTTNLSQRFYLIKLLLP